MAKGSNDGCANVVGGIFVFAIVVIAAIPKPVWIAIGIVAGVATLIAVVVKLIGAYEIRREQARTQEAARLKANEAAEKEHREEHERREKQQRISALGSKNAELVESAETAARRLAATEAARTGWLGDVDFTADIQTITDNFHQVHSLRGIAGELSALDKPTADDRRILAEAKATSAGLERAACERVELIKKCAIEAQRIDESLRNERKDARTAEQRAELHAKLSAMLYGIEATPATPPKNSAADAVLARVQAYREIKHQIDQARNNGPR
jgi:hypothetical protein